MGDAGNNPKRYERTVFDDGEIIIHTPIIEGLSENTPSEQQTKRPTLLHLTESAPSQPQVAQRPAPLRVVPPGTTGIAVSPRPKLEARPAQLTERNPKRAAVLGIVAILGFGGTVAAKSLFDGGNSAPKNTAMNKKVAQPGTTTPDNLSNLQAPPPSPTDLSLVMPIVQGKASKPAKPNKTTAPDAKLNTVIPSPDTSHETVITPPLTWQPTAPLPTNSHNTPTPTTPEASTIPTTPTPETPSPTPTLELSPSATSSRLLRESINTTRKQELLAQYPELVNYLDLKSLAANGELNDLNKSAIIDHQKIMDAYSNPSVHVILGDPVWLSEKTLTTLAGSGDSPASQLVANSDNALRGAQVLYQNQATGDLAAKIPYLNGNYVQSALTSLQNGESLSVPVAENAVVLDAQRATLPDESKIELVAVVADYTRDSTTKTILTWELAEPNGSNAGEFVGVTVYKEELAAVTSISPTSTLGTTTTPDAMPSPATTPDSTPTTADRGNFLSNFWGSIFGNNNNKGHEHKRGHN